MTISRGYIRYFCGSPIRERREVLHYCVLVFTEKLPTENEIGKIMEPYREDFDRPDTPVFEWDWYQIGGRYGGKLKLKLDESYNTYSRTTREGTQFISAHLRTFLNGFPEFLQSLRCDDALCYMGARDGFIYCDGAKVSALIDFETTNGFVAIDTDGTAVARETYDRRKEKFIKNENYDAEVSAMKKRNADNFVTIVDIHD